MKYVKQFLFWAALIGAFVYWQHSDVDWVGNILVFLTWIYGLFFLLASLVCWFALIAFRDSPERIARQGNKPLTKTKKYVWVLHIGWAFAWVAIGYMFLGFVLLVGIVLLMAAISQIDKITESTKQVEPQ